MSHGDFPSPTVIHVLTSFGFGGVERRMRIVAAHAAAGSTRHLFVAIGGGGATEEMLRNLGAEVICLEQPTRIPSPMALLALLDLFRRLRPQAVHTHGAEANFHGLVAAWLARVPARIGEEIGIPEHSWRARLLFRQVYRCAARVIGMSRRVADWLVENGEVPESKVALIHNPVELPEPRHSGPDPAAPFRMIFVGRLEKVKNPAVLVEVVRRLKGEGKPVELWLIGEGGERAALEERVARHGLEEQVVFLGYQHDPASFVRQCDVCVQPSFSEGFSQSLVEAMGCAVPVIVTATGSAPEIVQHGVTGWLVAFPDLELMLDAVRTACEAGAEALFEMGQRARASVEGRFDPAKYLRELDALYRSAALGGDPAPGELSSLGGSATGP